MTLLALLLLAALPLPPGYTFVPGTFEAGRQPDGNSVLRMTAFRCCLPNPSRKAARTIAGRRFAVLLAPHAATEGDVWLYDEAARVLIVGDLVVAFAPFMDTACIAGWQKALGEIAATPFAVLIPGHGEPMSRVDFDRWHKAFDGLVDCDAPEAECVAGWRTDVAPFLSGIAPARVDGMIAYYLRTRLRTPAGERDRYCPAG